MKISSVADKGHKGIILMCFGIFAFPLWFVVPVGMEQDVVAGGGKSSLSIAPDAMATERGM
jgi:hypothetical protein